MRQDATMTSTQTPATTRRRRPQLERDTAMQLAATEYVRVLDQFRELSEDDWRRPTDCDGWDVRAMAGHTVGMTKMAGSMRESMRQDRAAGRRGGNKLDALTALQVEEHAPLTTGELIDQFEEVHPRTAHGRRRMPAVVRRLPLPGPQDVGDRVERWTIGFLNDVILTRDPWMHRMDISRATGREPVLTADHDGVLVADVVQEWAGRHGRPYRLELTGTAGGTFVHGEEGPELCLDAIDFCRVLSGREAERPDHELLDVQVPF
jgi:uncharacterized protein (TIGR03083 family)